MDGIFREMCSTQIFKNSRKGQRENACFDDGKGRVGNSEQVQTNDWDSNSKGEGIS